MPGPPSSNARWPRWPSDLPRSMGVPSWATVGSRPPFPHRMDPVSEILPCPGRRNWRHALQQIGTRRDITFGAIHDHGPSDEEIWHRLGRDAIAHLNAVNIRRFAASLKLLNFVVQPGPVPDTLEGRKLNVPKTQKRTEYGISMWGAPGSGKTTFLAALNIALTRWGKDWKVIGADEASTQKLISRDYLAHPGSGLSPGRPRASTISAGCWSARFRAAGRSCSARCSTWKPLRSRWTWPTLRARSHLRRWPNTDSEPI